MRQSEIHRTTYDVIFSLGSECLTGLQLREHQLRTMAGPIDWMITDPLSKVSRLFHNRFSGFMLEENLQVIGIDLQGKNYLVNDLAYGIVSGHDFAIENNPPGPLTTYAEFRTKMDRRIARFNRVMNQSSMILFVRLYGTEQEAKELESVLSQWIPRRFHVLLLIPGQTESPTDLQWPLKRVCALEIPDIPRIWETSMWGEIFSNIHLK
ncbi:hypothetical protein SY83_16520 [Paenibacillus swuensis]|uniref:Peptidase n=1 Tax=Paenibacillus swuensis TaxID=1178515 RepID=A0A172TPJ4_9BACL|nr:hypothetical protein SY83_16520 [Paenibacillus swuensis]